MEVAPDGGRVEGAALRGDERPRRHRAPAVPEGLLRPLGLEAVEQVAEVGADVDQPRAAALRGADDGGGGQAGRT